MPDRRTIRRYDPVKAGVMRAQDPNVLSRVSPERDRRLEDEKIGSTVEDLTVTDTFAHQGTLYGVYGQAPVTRQGPFTQTYATADPTLSAYTPDAETVAYTGLAAGLPATPYAAVTDLEALRAAYENLRAFTEDLAQFTNALVDALQLGPIS